MLLSLWSPKNYALFTDLIGEIFAATLNLFNLKFVCSSQFSNLMVYDYYTGCRNVSHCQKRSRLELRSLERYRIYSIKRHGVY